MDARVCCRRLRTATVPSSSSLLWLLLVVVVVVFAGVVPGVNGQGPSVSSCPSYVLQGTGFTCSCTGVNSQATITWPGYSNNSTLTVNKVEQSDNDKEYVCQYELNGMTSTISYTLRVAYGPVTATIDGPASAIAYGDRELNLTCSVSDVNPSAMFLWYPPDPARSCKAGSDEQHCVYRPVPADDGKEVTCKASNSFVSASHIEATATYTLELKYPPPNMPTIFMPSSQTIPLKHGDVIKCSVSGGKPRVTAVIFYCQKPDLADEEDEVSPDTRTVTSSIFINTTEADVDNTSCRCRANWETEPGLYSGTTEMDFVLQYKGVVSNFTLNEVQELTVQETDHSSVHFLCTGSGRPAPQLGLQKRGSDNLLVKLDTSTGNDQLTYTLNNAVCENMGHYVCLADNGFSDPLRSAVMLTVNCAPRLLNPPLEPSTPMLAAEGLTYLVVAHPTPTTEVHFLGHRGNATAQEPAKDGAFQVSVRRNSSMEHVVHVFVRPVDIPKDRTGLYSLLVFNDLGNVTVSFEIDTPVVLPKKEPSNETLIIVLSVVGAMLVVLIIVVLVNCRRLKNKKAGRNINGKSYENPEMDMNTPGKHRGTGSPPTRFTPPTMVENGARSTSAHTTSSAPGRKDVTEDPEKVADLTTPMSQAVSGDKMADQNGLRSPTDPGAYDNIGFVNKYENADVDADGYARLGSSCYVNPEPASQPSSSPPEVPTSSVSGPASGVIANQPDSKVTVNDGDVYATIDHNRKRSTAESQPAKEAAAEEDRANFSGSNIPKREEGKKSDVALPLEEHDRRTQADSGMQPKSIPTKKHVTTISVSK